MIKIRTVVPVRAIHTGRQLKNSQGGKKRTVKDVLSVVGEKKHEDLFADARQIIRKREQKDGTLKSGSTIKSHARSASKKNKEPHKTKPQQLQSLDREVHFRNVSTPHPAQKITPIRSANEINEIKVHKGDHTETVEDILRVVSQEMASHVDPTRLTKDINTNVAKMKEIQASIEESKRRDLLLTRDDPALKELKELNREELEHFLREAKSSKERDEEMHFNEIRRFESMQNLNSSRTLDKKNFFSPIDEKLIRTVRSESIPRMINEVPKDDLFFPTLPHTLQGAGSENMTHEFMVLVDGKQIITGENPFGPHYRAPDLVTIFQELGNEKKYWKQVNKLEGAKWKLIGMQPLDSSNILVFERFIDKLQEKRDKGWRIAKKWSMITGLSLIVMYGLGEWIDDDL